MLRPLLRLFGVMEDPNTPAFAPREVARHNHEASLWLTCRGAVYDVTDFVHGHPGGAMALIRRGGGNRDCQQDFDFHSAMARKQWADYRIGIVAEKTGVNNAAAGVFLDAYYTRRGLNPADGQPLASAAGAAGSAHSWETPASWSPPLEVPTLVTSRTTSSPAGPVTHHLRQQPPVGSSIAATAAICENCGHTTYSQPMHSSGGGVSYSVGGAASSFSSRGLDMGGNSSGSSGSGVCSITGTSHQYCLMPPSSNGSSSVGGGDHPVVVNGGRTPDTFALAEASRYSH